MTHSSPGAAMEHLLRHCPGVTIHRDPALADAVTAGFVAVTNSGSYLLTRVGVHYEWRLI